MSPKFEGAVLIRRNEEITQGRDPVQTEAEMTAMLPRARDTKDGQQPPRARREAGGRSSFRAGTDPAHTLLSDF